MEQLNKRTIVSIIQIHIYTHSDISIDWLMNLSKEKKKEIYLYTYINIIVLYWILYINYDCILETANTIMKIKTKHTLNMYWFNQVKRDLSPDVPLFAHKIN